MSAIWKRSGANSAIPWTWLSRPVRRGRRLSTSATAPRWRGSDWTSCLSAPTGLTSRTRQAGQRHPAPCQSQPEVDSRVVSDVSSDAVLSRDGGLRLSVVFGDEGVDLSEAAGLVAVLNRPHRPFRNLLVQGG